MCIRDSHKCIPLKNIKLQMQQGRISASGHTDPHKGCLLYTSLLKALHRADDQFSSMGPVYFLQCWQEARTGFDRYFYDVWDRY